MVSVAASSHLCPLLAGCVLCLLVLPACRGTLEEVLSLGNPVINFGGWFHVDFPNDTFARLYDCLCNSQIIACSIGYKMRLGRFHIPTHYTVTQLELTKAISDVTGVYKNVVLCNVLLAAFQHSITCYRQAVVDKTCDWSEKENKHGNDDDDGECMYYSLKTDYGSCSYECSMLIWIADFTIPFEFYNLGTLPGPKFNGFCPTPENTVTQTLAPSDNVFVLNTTATSGNLSSKTGQGSNSSANSGVGSTTSQGDGASFSILIAIAAAVGGAVLIVVGVAYLSRTLTCCGVRDKPPKALTAPSPGSDPSASLPDGEEEDYYDILEEVDDKGYQVIKNCLPPPGQYGPSSRPLPAPPRPSDRRANPTPHRRLVNLNDYQHMGVVNLRGDHPASSADLEQAKLVKSQEGSLELISIHDDLFVFSSLYTKVQLVHTGNPRDPLRVVAFLPEQLDVDNPSQFPDTEDSGCHSDERIPVGQTDPDRVSQISYRGGNPYENSIVYIGTVELVDKASLSSSDYLTVIDIDPSIFAADYITPEDLGSSAG